MATETLQDNELSTSRAVNISLWIVQIIAAAIFFGAGVQKLADNPAMIHTFEVIGWGQWFRYFTGVIEIVAAGCLLTQRYSGVGAVLLVPTMIGAILAHLFLIGGSPMLPIILVTFMAIVAIGRKDHVLRYFGW